MSVNGGEPDVARTCRFVADGPLADLCKVLVCTENLIRVDEVMESPKLAE
jgi:hypothetical protein